MSWWWCIGIKRYDLAKQGITVLTSRTPPFFSNSLFANCNGPLIKKLDALSASGAVDDMETLFCSVSLDIIGKAVFNFPFNSVDEESPIIKVS